MANTTLSFFVVVVVCLVCCCCPELRWSSHLLRVLSVDPRRPLVSVVEPVEEQQQKARGSLKDDAGRWSGGWQAVGWQCGLAHQQLVSQRLQGDTGRCWRGKQCTAGRHQGAAPGCFRHWTSRKPALLLCKWVVFWGFYFLKKDSIRQEVGHTKLARSSLSVTVQKNLATMIISGNFPLFNSTLKLLRQNETPPGELPALF